jgi:aspartyl/glutamyl-tRNA(Asn/Gln) amidotransferase C subunit
MIVDDALVLRLERLAALSLEAEERTRVAADLTRFLGYVAELGESDAAATATPAAPADDAGIVHTLRPDTVVPFAGRTEALAGAPELDGTAFLVPRFNP